jgi:REP element-mobilizing transposase RayT
MAATLGPPTSCRQPLWYCRHPGSAGILPATSLVLPASWERRLPAGRREPASCRQIGANVLNAETGTDVQAVGGGRHPAGGPNDVQAAVGGRQDAGGPRGWHSRGYLPHCDGGDIVQMVTFRLADSFPRKLLVEWQDELAHLSEEDATAERRRRIEAHLDKGTGAAWLRDARVARLVQEALLYFDGNRYRLHAWVIMPNHVHVLLTPVRDHSLSSIVQSWKSYTAVRANRLLQRQGAFWHRDYFDRYIRDDRHFAAAVTYVEANPVRAGLCASSEEWVFSSAARLP